MCEKIRMSKYAVKVGEHMFQGMKSVTMTFSQPHSLFTILRQEKRKNHVVIFITARAVSMFSEFKRKQAIISQNEKLCHARPRQKHNLQLIVAHTSKQKRHCLHFYSHVSALISLSQFLH